jgi:hypothetical protein
VTTASSFRVADIAWQERRRGDARVLPQRRRADLAAAVDFYDQRFHIGLTAGEKSHLVVFLHSL